MRPPASDDNDIIIGREQPTANSILCNHVLEPEVNTKVITMDLNTLLIQTFASSS